MVDTLVKSDTNGQTRTRVMAVEPAYPNFPEDLIDSLSWEQRLVLAIEHHPSFKSTLDSLLRAWPTEPGYNG